MRVVFSFIFSFILLLNTSFAFEFPNANIFIKAGTDPNNKLNTGSLIEALDQSLGNGLVGILKLLYNVGLVVSMGVLLFMGIQILLANPQKKAQLKASLTPYFVGLLLFVAGVPIAMLIINIFITIF